MSSKGSDVGSAGHAGDVEYTTSGAGAQGGKSCGRRRDGWGQTGLSSTLGNPERQAGAVSFLWHQESLQNFKGVPRWKLCLTQMLPAAGVQEEA